MCFNLASSFCISGHPAFIIEGNTELQIIEISPQFNFNVDEYLFVIINNPKLTQDVYLIFEQCKGCVFEYGTSKLLLNFKIDLISGLEVIFLLRMRT